jgi:hypothetical protein
MKPTADQMSTVSAKQRAQRAVDEMPDDATLEDVIERLVLIHKVERGLEEVHRGEGLETQEEVEAYFLHRRATRGPA